MILLANNLLPSSAVSLTKLTVQILNGTQVLYSVAISGANLIYKVL